MRVLVTGATGFVGSALLRRLIANGTPATGTARSLDGRVLEGSTDWSGCLSEVGCVVHTAARVHVMRESASDPMAEFRRVNVHGTLALASQAAQCGVRRFVFVSSVKVNGECTQYHQPFTETDTPAPLDAYGISKLEAETALHEIAAQTGLDVVIVRPPLVYGPGVKANFAALMRAVHRGMPLPLGSVHNRRSLLALDNLVDFLVTCIAHPQAARQTFLVSDGEDLSTPDLIRGMGQAMGRQTRLFPFPPSLLRVAAATLGKGDAIQRLCGNLQVDIHKARQLLGWAPPVTVAEGLRRAVVGGG